MSSLATFYLLAESDREACIQAHRSQRIVTYKRSLFGTREVTTGDRFFWEYLDSASVEKIDFPFSGFAVIDYLFTFAPQWLPSGLQIDLENSSLDENYYLVSQSLAVLLADSLGSQHPDEAKLHEFAVEQAPQDALEYVPILRETHEFLRGWFSSIPVGSFGVIHLTF
jgi:hypothetical protein